MRATPKFMLVVVTAGVALVASVFSAFASSNGRVPASAALVAAHRTAADGRAAPTVACTDMQASAIAWVTLDSQHHIDQQVSTYPSGTNRITPVFQVSCVPDNAPIVSAFSLNGQIVWTDQETLPATNFPRLYGYALETADGSALSDGTWGIQYFNGNTRLTIGSVYVGNVNGDPSQTTGVTLQGTVVDQASGQPIAGVQIDVLNPGTQTVDWVRNQEPDSDVFGGAKSDSQGAFTINKKLARHTIYGVVATARTLGYQIVTNPTFQIMDEPDPVSLVIAMTK